MKEEYCNYLKHAYDYEGRFYSYWYQIREILAIAKNGTVLEAGPGNNFLSDYLSKRGIKIETLDIIPDSNPTYLGNVTSIPCKNDQFDCVAGFEILEHLPFKEFKVGLREMARVSKKWIVFSVPDIRWFISIDLRVFSSTKHLRWLWSFPRMINRYFYPAEGAKEHHWEIGRPNINIKKITTEINATALILERHYRIPSNPIHHIFILKKSTL